MALITCPECKNMLSTLAKVCPSCGYPLAEVASDIIRIKIDKLHGYQGCAIYIFNADTKELITRVYSGSVAEIKSDDDLKIYFSKTKDGTKIMFTTVVSPKNGGRYCAYWKEGPIIDEICSCTRVDFIVA